MKNVNMVYLIILCFLLTGCQTIRRVVLHPIQDYDFFSIKENSDIIFIDKEGNKTIKTAKKDGYYLSKFYLNEVVNARINE